LRLPIHPQEEFAKFSKGVEFGEFDLLTLGGKDLSRCSFRVNPFRGREATTPSVIRKIREVQRQEEAPPEGGAITPKDVHMKPFRSKGEFNPSLHSRVIHRPRGPDGLPGGHADFNGGHPGLRKDFVDGVAVVEVLAASLGPKVV